MLSYGRGEKEIQVLVSERTVSMSHFLSKKPPCLASWPRNPSFFHCLPQRALQVLTGNGERRAPAAQPHSLVRVRGTSARDASTCAYLWSVFSVAFPGPTPHAVLATRTPACSVAKPGSAGVGARAARGPAPGALGMLSGAGRAPGASRAPSAPHSSAAKGSRRALSRLCARCPLPSRPPRPLVPTSAASRRFPEPWQGSATPLPSVVPPTPW